MYVYILPSLKLTFSHLKIDPWKFGDSYWETTIFRGYVSFRECIRFFGGEQRRLSFSSAKNTGDDDDGSAIFVQVVTRWGFGKSMATLLARAGASVSAVEFSIDLGGSANQLPPTYPLKK